MRKQKSDFTPPTMGGSALLVIFSVLCLTVFAVLSLATVCADARLSQKSAEAVSDYYQADVQAETILAQLRSGVVPEGVTENGDRYVFSCPISETQNLQVEVEVTGKTYTVLHWQTSSAVEWEADENLHLWDGE